MTSVPGRKLRNWNPELGFIIPTSWGKSLSITIYPSDDLFHKRFSDEFICQVFNVIRHSSALALDYEFYIDTVYRDRAVSFLSRLSFDWKGKGRVFLRKENEKVSVTTCYLEPILKNLHMNYL